MPSSSLHNTLSSLLVDWFTRSARSLPWRQTRDPYKILISEFMLQQTQVVTVIPYFQRWMKQFPDFESLANANEQAMLRAWEGLGYYSRARNLHRTAKEVVQKHQGKLPPDASSIRALPGVGPYTAGAIASFAFNLPEPAIDANVQRVLARLFDIREEISSVAAKSKLDTHARKLLAAANPNHGAINAAVMELGALVCSSRKPECHRCPVSQHCTNRENADDLPLKRPKAQLTQRDEFARWDFTENGLLLQLRTGPRWRNLWTLPELTPPQSTCSPLLVQRFAVTRFQISLHILPIETPSPECQEHHETGFQRVPLRHLDELPLAAPHRKAINTLLNQLTLAPLSKTPSTD